MSNARSNNLTHVLEAKIRFRAYELFQERGCEHGRDLDDWLQAEAEFLQQSDRAPAPRSIASRKKKNGN